MIGLIRIRAEKNYAEQPESPHQLHISRPNPSHRVMDVPRDQADLIVSWYRKSGWTVTAEEI